MNARTRISAYTPSNMDPELLKRIFVQREKLLDLIVNRLTTSMSSGDKHHILLVGPRGSGKTHLVTLAVWELKQNAELIDTMRIAWLGEDDVFSGLIHFAFAIAKSLADEYPNEFPSDFKSGVRGLPQDDAALAVLDSVIRNLKHRHLLIVTENLDQTFESLGELGQKKLRAFLQETRRIATLSTTQRLFAGVSSRKEAFFGFFDTHHLAPLTVDDALELIRNIAVEQRKTDLIQYLNSHQARYRIRALHHLAGGNYRMYVLLSEFLTGETLDDLVSAFESLAEEMTPYFQERMRSLPDQQRQLVQCLCDAPGAMTVKEIAEETFIAEGNCSKQLGHLKSKGYVRSEKRGKESYYDMAEPLMRLCLEVKNQRGRPLKLVSRFLKAWFPEDRLQSSLKMNEIDSRSAEYCRFALQHDDSFMKVINRSLVIEIIEKIQAGDFERAITLAADLAVSDQTYGDRLRVIAHGFKRKSENEDKLRLKMAAIEQQRLTLEKAVSSIKHSDWESAIIAFTNFLSINDSSIDGKTIAHLFRGYSLVQLGNFRAAIEDFALLSNLPGAPIDMVANGLINRGMAYVELGDTKLAIDDFNTVIQMPVSPHLHKAKAIALRGATYGKSGNLQSALVDFNSFLKMPDLPDYLKAQVLACRGAIHWHIKNWQASISDIEASLNMPDALSDRRTLALFVLLEPMIPIRPLQEVVTTLERAFETGDKSSEHYGGTPEDLISMILERAPSEWADYVSAIAPLYIRYSVAEKLGQGLTRSIRNLDEGGFSSSQLDLWNQTWRNAGKDCEDLQIPLACLDAAVEILKSEVPNDRPLFRLPLEIRELIRPLLRKSLPPD